MAERTDKNRARIIGVPREIAACADEVAEVAERVCAQLESAVVGDAEAAVSLAHAASAVALRLAELNDPT